VLLTLLVDVSVLAASGAVN